MAEADAVNRCERAGAFRVIYVATFADVVCVLHAFQKKRGKPRNGMWIWRRRGCGNRWRGCDDH